MPSRIRSLSYGRRTSARERPENASALAQTGLFPAAVIGRDARCLSATEPAASDEPADVDLEVLAGRLVDALNENPVVPEGSELSWLGTVVRLQGHSGPHATVASDGIHAGHIYGLVHDGEGMMWLARDHRDPAPHDALGELVGRRAEVFGITQEDDNVYVVRVSLSRLLN